MGLRGSRLRAPNFNDLFRLFDSLPELRCLKGGKVTIINKLLRFMAGNTISFRPVGIVFPFVETKFTPVYLHIGA